MKEKQQRASWAGVIEFGKLNIPVKLYKAVQEEDNRLKFIHKGCGGEVGKKSYCKNCGIILGNEEIVKGFPNSEGVNIYPDTDLIKSEAQEVGKILGSVDILRFIDINKFIDYRLVKSSYFVVPQENASKSLAVLRDAMKKRNVIGFGIIYFKTKKESIVFVPNDETIMAYTIHNLNSLKPLDKFKIENRATKKQCELAAELIDIMRGDFEEQENDINIYDIIIRVTAGNLKKEEMKPKEKVRNITRKLNASLDLIRR